MKIRALLCFLPIVVLMSTTKAENAVAPEPGPEEAGLRLRFVVEPRTDASREGYAVRVDLINVSERPVTVRASWRNDESGGFSDYLEAATSIECVPPIKPWMGQIQAGHRQAPQPEQILKPGVVVSARWETSGRHLKNRLIDPLTVQDPELSFPGLYSVHATVTLVVGERTIRLRSNEQLVSAGRSRAMPRATLGQLLSVDSDKRNAVLSLGSLHQVEAGDQFEYQSMRDQGRLTVTTVRPEFSVGTLEVIVPTNGPPPARGTELTLRRKK